MTARDMFKRMLADALEQVCLLTEQLEDARAEISRLSEAKEAVNGDEPVRTADSTRAA